MTTTKRVKFTKLEAEEEEILPMGKNFLPLTVPAATEKRLKERSGLLLGDDIFLKTIFMKWFLRGFVRCQLLKTV